MKQLIPFSIRFGHATNSSSTHSLVLAPENAKDDKAGSKKWEFWCDNFVAASAEAKRLYAAAQICAGLSYRIKDKWSCAALAAALCGLSLKDVDRVMHATVDHQSVWALPSGRELTIWAKEIVDFLVRRDDVAIVGGNDNDYVPPQDILPGCRLWDGYLPVDGRNNLIVRRDPVYRYWTVYNRETGARVRFRWGDAKLTPRRASIPELVDLKITEVCHKGCKYCYEDARPDGRHAEYVESMLWSLTQLGVFEIVLGGGEPTEHPNFNRILNSFAFGENGTHVSFTTRNIAWLRQNWGSLPKHVRAVGVSCDTAKDVDELVAIDRNNREGRSIDTVIHIIPELYGNRPEEFWRLLGACTLGAFPVLFLGLKNTGRAKLLKAALPPDFWPRVAKSHLCGIRVDTLFAKKYANDLERLNVHRVLYDLDDGAWSCYIDAVKGMIGPNSYETRRFRKINPMSGEEILKAFRSWRGS